MKLDIKSMLFGSVSTLAIGTATYYVSRWRKNTQEIMEVIFTHDKTEEENTLNVKYLEVSDLQFTPRNLKRIEEYINSAVVSIDAAVYLFNVKQLGSALIRAHERGVTVRVVGCKSMQGATGTQFQELRKAGIAVLFKDTTMCMHHKFCLIDTRKKTDSEKRQTEALLAAIKRKKLARDMQAKFYTTNDKNGSTSSDEQKTLISTLTMPEQGICITGSCNWTMQGFSSNWENVIITSNKIIIHAFRQEFDRIWEDFKKAQTITNTSEVLNQNL